MIGPRGRDDCEARERSERRRGLGAEAHEGIQPATAHPLPAGGATAGEADLAEMEQVRQAALETVYPETGFAPEDPRLTPVGMPLVAYAVAAKAVGWANEDDALVDRVVRALGHTREDYDKAGDHWTPMLKTDMAVATLYGQLFANVGDLPVKTA